MATRATFIRPDIAVVLGVARTHTVAFGTLEATAAEKVRLVQALRPGGLAVLNTDDSRVAAMTVPPGCDILRFGTGPEAHVRGTAIPAHWPDRFSFRASVDGETETVRTRLVGAHWMPVALAALAVAHRAGVPLGTAAAALAEVAPVFGRLEPVRLPGGAIILRDDCCGAIDTLDAAVDVLTTAVATRRILLVTDYSDSGENRKHRLRHLARAAGRSADLAVFVGETAAYGGRRAVEAGLAPDRVRDFRTLEETAAFLRGELSAGDVLLLKGRTTEHATRIFYALLGSIRCWKTTCRRRIPCDLCWEFGARHADRRRAVPVAPPGPEA